MKYDYIIVGQGIAGSMLAWFLLKKQKKILVIDEYHTHSSSNIAAGVVNPITGRKMVKSWMIDEVLPFAKDTYKELEGKLGISFFYEQEIYKIFTSDEDHKVWNEKKADKEYQNYLGEITAVEERNISARFNAGIIKQACWMDVPKFIKAFRQFLKEENSLSETAFIHNELKIENVISYQSNTADGIFFCEGYKAIYNPLFQSIPFTLAKGEQLLIHAGKLNTEKLWNKNLFIIPKGSNHYNIGSTFLWNDTTEEITEAGRNELVDKMEKIICCEYEIIEEKAGIRPTIKDRRPVVGKHEIHNNIFVFNGMGTKGVSLSPYFAAYLVDSVLNNKPVMKEISLSRFID